MDGSEWCQKGAEWSMNANSAEQAKMVIVGIETTGKYEGYCHVTYDLNAPDIEMNTDFYFNEEGNGYQIMNVNGQKFESEYSG